MMADDSNVLLSRPTDSVDKANVAYRVEYCTFWVWNFLAIIEKGDPISRVEKVTTTLIDWVETYVPTYIRKEKLFLFATKLRQQFIGNLRSCRAHPDGDSGISQRSNTDLLQEHRTLLEKLVPDKLAAMTRSRYQTEKQNPLELLGNVSDFSPKIAFYQV